ncbi:hypothetical protein M378DRAFT_163683 [Amanita muscaria Koide BX008]|uniref:Uncharacterized protein n=1 Tax=Amanita muscaria (strain Koide BX008) TaxID=946122 RepID=A0A0C2WQN8_AMAMK|nr:hypothetical protein M378DRAFT_163683 [Amanita muscaria Koide BX008]
MTSYKDANHRLPESSLSPSSHSKHSDNAYTSWLEHFLRQISTDIYFFTSPDLESLHALLRSHYTSTPPSQRPFPFHPYSTSRPCILHNPITSIVKNGGIHQMYTPTRMGNPTL